MVYYLMNSPGLKLDICIVILSSLNFSSFFQERNMDEEEIWLDAYTQMKPYYPPVILF